MAFNLGSSKEVPFIVNKISHTIKVKYYVPKIVKLFKKHKLELVPYITDDIEEFKSLCSKFRKKKKAVIIGGGDGSINLAADLIAESSTVMGIIPFGTSNVLANDLGLPMNPLKAAERILEGNHKAIDLGKIGDKHFALMISFGFDGYAVQKTIYWLKHVSGKLPYVLSGIAALFRYKFPEASIKLKNGEKYKGHTLIVCNTKYYGGKFIPIPDTKHDDGKFHILIIESKGNKGIFSIIKEWLLLARGKLYKHPDAKVLVSEELAVYTEAKDYFQMDGDPYVLENHFIKIVKGALEVFV